MDDLFETKGIKPMLIGAESDAFDSPDYLYELKLDGERCIAYLNLNKTDLRSKRNMKMLSKVPELSQIHRQVKVRCILDGELCIIRNGKPDFSLIQRRSMMSDPLKIKLDSQRNPACFTAFDILYYEDHLTTNFPLTERKKLLQSIVEIESSQFAVSRTIENDGIAFYQLAETQDLEGIVAKRKDSKYYFDKRTKDWIKCKYLKDDDFVVCGFLPKDNGMTSLVLGQYQGSKLIYKGHVTLSVSGEAYQKIQSVDRVPYANMAVPEGNEKVIWIAPKLVCTVKYMMINTSGSLRQPIFKGLREDKHPEECLEHTDKK